LVFVIIAFLLAGCGPDVLLPNGSTPAASAATCEDAKAQLYTGDNYPDLKSMRVKEAADKIFGRAATPEKLAKAKVAALNLLRDETDRWSDPQIIQVPDKLKIRAIVTFISPGLIRAIVLNEALKIYNQSSQPPSLDTLTNNALEKIGKKNELAFMLLIQTEGSNTPKTFSIFPVDMTLHNTAGLQATRTRNDDFLNSPLNFSESSNTGLIFYPNAVKSSLSQCTPFLDTDSDTSLMLRTEAAKIDGENTIITWKFYFPLLASINNQSINVELSDNPTNGDESNAFPLEEPPSVNFDRNRKSIPWREVGRFIWWKLIMDHIPVQ